MLIAKCPNDPTHDRFVTSICVTQDWVVDEHGNFIDCVVDCNDVVAPPCKENIWTCDICGAEAIVEEIIP